MQIANDAAQLHVDLIKAVMHRREDQIQPSIDPVKAIMHLAAQLADLLAQLGNFLQDHLLRTGLLVAEQTRDTHDRAQHIAGGDDRAQIE